MCMFVGLALLDGAEASMLAMHAGSTSDEGQSPCGSPDISRHTICPMTRLEQSNGSFKAREFTFCRNAKLILFAVAMDKQVSPALTRWALPPQLPEFSRQSSLSCLSAPQSKPGLRCRKAIGDTLVPFKMLSHVSPVRTLCMTLHVGPASSGNRQHVCFQSCCMSSMCGRTHYA